MSAPAHDPQTPPSAPTPPTPPSAPTPAAAAGPQPVPAAGPHGNPPQPAPAAAAAAAPAPAPAPAPRPSVRDATPADLVRTASWQCDNLGLGLFPRLGKRFVRRWHSTYLDSPHGIALIAEVDEGGTSTPVGFLIGSADERRHLQHVLRHHRWTLAATGLLALLCRPALATRFAHTRLGPYARRVLLRRPPSRPSTPAAPAVGSDRTSAATPGDLDDARAPAVLTAVVVDPARRTRGAGVLLVGEFLDRAARAGAERAELVTVDGPGGAGPFYERLGWVGTGSSTSKDGERLLRFTKELAPPRDAGHGDQ